MRTLLHHFIFLSLALSSLWSIVDERKSDLYYANGINVKLSEDMLRSNWTESLKLHGLLDNQAVAQNIADYKVAYNVTQGIINDVYEAAEQKISSDWGWETFAEYFRIYLELKLGQTVQDTHIPDLTKQVDAYKQSIKDGHGVIVIAHSQGNFYTNEAYEKLDNWMKSYFHMFSVATPSDHVAGYAAGDTTAPYVKFTNDPLFALGLPSNRIDPNPEHYENVSFAAHGFFESYMAAANTQKDIFDFISAKTNEQTTKASQWSTQEVNQKGTCEYRIKVQHRFDSSVIVEQDIYPFAPSQKLYPAPLYVNSDEKLYVKGSYGNGNTRILDAKADTWDNMQENQCYKLEGTNPAEYIVKESCPDTTLFEVVSHEDIGTANWRVTVRNKETNATTSNVYPFNLNGSLYQLDSGEWIIASCGGIAIESSWSGQQSKEVYRLIGTGEIIKVYTLLLDIYARQDYVTKSYRYTTRRYYDEMREVNTYRESVWSNQYDGLNFSVLPPLGSYTSISKSTYFPGPGEVLQTVKIDGFNISNISLVGSVSRWGGKLIGSGVRTRAFLITAPEILGVGFAGDGLDYTDGNYEDIVYQIHGVKVIESYNVYGVE